jgi:lipoprotein-anchoring transpeptidase ErfK/SrfK
MAEFPVVVPYPAEEPPKLPVRGIVKRIERNPSWYPTKRTQDVFLQKRKIVLPKVVKSDNPLNPLGTVKVVVDWHDPNKSTARIYGTSEPGLLSLPPDQRHRSGGCIRLLNKDADKLVSLIQSEAVSVHVLYVR